MVRECQMDKRSDKIHLMTMLIFSKQLFNNSFARSLWGSLVGHEWGTWGASLCLGASRIFLGCPALTTALPECKAKGINDRYRP